MSSNRLQKRAQNPQQKPAEVGGWGYKLRGYENGTSPQSPSSSSSSQLPAALALPSGSRSLSAAHMPQQAATAPQLLPVSTKQLEATPALLKLQWLYSELQAVESAYAFTSQYLPKLQNTGTYVTDSIKSRMLQIRAEIAALAKPAGGNGG